MTDPSYIRFLLGLFLPAPMSFISFWLLAHAQSILNNKVLAIEDIKGLLPVAAFFIFFAYFLIGIQSIIYTILMEKIAYIHSAPRSKFIYYGYGFIFGALSGLSLLIVNKDFANIGTLLWGGLTGFQVAVIMGFTFRVNKVCIKNP